MSGNDERVQEATLLFIEQIRVRPMQVVANLNSLLEEHGIELCFRQCRKPAKNIFAVEEDDVWQPPPEMRGA